MENISGKSAFSLDNNDENGIELEKSFRKSYNTFNNILNNKFRVFVIIIIISCLGKSGFIGNDNNQTPSTEYPLKSNVS